MRWFYLATKNSGNYKEIYERKCPPNNSVYECWTTVGIWHNGAEVTFIEYDYYDKDPDGVREAFGSTYDSEYSITANFSGADPEKLFIYTVTGDGNVTSAPTFDINTSRAVYIFIEPTNISKELLLSITEKAEDKSLTAREIEEMLRSQLLDDREDIACLALFVKVR